MEIESRRILHFNVTEHPTAGWAIQQFREFLVFEHPYRFLIHDRDGIFSPGLDSELRSFGLRVLKTPRRAPQANVKGGVKVSNQAGAKGDHFFLT
jgi:hypothetical protein